MNASSTAPAVINPATESTGLIIALFEIETNERVFCGSFAAFLIENSIAVQDVRRMAHAISANLPFVLGDFRIERVPQKGGAS